VTRTDFVARQLSRGGLFELVGIVVPLVALIASGCGGGVRILTYYGDSAGPGGRPRLFGGVHAGLDVAGNHGDPVLAAADGQVAIVISLTASCGNGVIIRHRQFERFTVYCHLQETRVQIDQMVKRGDVIGLMGDTGDAGSCKPACPHVHFELSSVASGHPNWVPGVTFDPLPLIAGCFDPNKTYASDRLVLTYPIRC
jgi:murein DD-endopeptidase MepM/ murein hydrolase activator NlpD